MIEVEQKAKLKAKRTAERLAKRKALVDSFSPNGNVSADMMAAVLGIGVSTLWAHVKAGKIRKPLKLSARTSVWSGKYAEYVRDNGFDQGGQL